MKYLLANTNIQDCSGWSLYEIFWASLTHVTKFRGSKFGVLCEKDVLNVRYCELCSDLSCCVKLDVLSVVLGILVTSDVFFISFVVNVGVLLLLFLVGWFRQGDE